MWKTDIYMMTVIVTMKTNVQNDDDNCICCPDFLAEVRAINMANGYIDCHLH